MSCGPEADSDYPGASSQVRASPSAKTKATPPKRWAHWTRLGELTELGRYRSRGHGDSHRQARLLVSESVASTFRGLVSSSRLPAGSLVAQQLFDPDGSAIAWYVMERGTNEWVFAELDNEGWIQPGAGRLCARCHAEGVADSLFGLPEGLVMPEPDAGAPPVDADR